ncbi:MAG: hypothetical protein RR296_05135 [Clostridia bacterium]
MVDYRIAYGCWLNDSRMEPIMDEQWPSIRIDEHTLESLDRTMAFLSEAGYNYLDVFGLITNHNWEDDIVSTVDCERKRQVEQVVEIVHRHGLKLIYGLGVYSWGFDGIIARNERVRGTSTQAMCASSSEADEIMRRVIDFVAQTFEVDGFHLEAADQGRCRCEKCAGIEDDIDYYNRINVRVADYIRARYPDKKLLVNTSGYLAWGDQFNAKQLGQMQALGEAIDVFIDVGSHGSFIQPSARANFIKDFHASFGTANGFWIYPPQHWDRLRWFIPHSLQNHAFLEQVFEAGGNGCELYLSPINNPGAEMTILTNGLFLQDTSRSADEVLNRAVERLYNPKSEAHRAKLVELFKEAENLFFRCWRPERDHRLDEALSDGVEHVFCWSQQAMARANPGEFFLEKLFGEASDFPCYLAVHFDRAGRARYRAGMNRLLPMAKELEKDDSSGRVLAICRCIENVLCDIEKAQRALDLC